MRFDGCNFFDKGGQAETGTAYAERLYPSCRTRSRGQSARELRLLCLERTRPPRPVLQILINWPIISAQFWASFLQDGLFRYPAIASSLLLTDHRIGHFSPSNSNCNTLGFPSVMGGSLPAMLFGICTAAARPGTLDGLFPPADTCTGGTVLGTHCACTHPQLCEGSRCVHANGATTMEQMSGWSMRHCPDCRCSADEVVPAAAAEARAAEQTADDAPPDGGETQTACPRTGDDTWESPPSTRLKHRAHCRQHRSSW